MKFVKIDREQQIHEYSKDMNVVNMSIKIKIFEYSKYT